MTLRAVQCATEAPYVDLRTKTNAEIDAICAGYPSPQEYERRRRRDATFDRISSVVTLAVAGALIALLCGLFFAPNETARFAVNLLGLGGK